MAARELVVLSSSPPGIPDSDCVVTPPRPNTSSPELPSLATLLSKRPAAYSTSLRSGSRAAEPPADATLGFESAAALIKQQKLTFDDDHEAEQSAVPKKTISREVATSSKLKKPTKRATEPVEIQEPGETTATKPRNTRSKALAEKAITSQVAKEGEEQIGDDAPSCVTGENGAEAKPKTRKPRAKKADTGTEDEPKRTRAVKSRSGTDDTSGKASKARKATGTASAHFSRATTDDEQSLETRRTVEATNDDQPLALEQAPARRMDWTPPKDTLSPALQRQTPVPLESLPDSPTAAVSRTTREGSFASLVSGFGYATDQGTEASKSKPRPKRHPSGEAFTKKRRIELIESVVPTAATTSESRALSLPKEKAPKKKPTTITELATAAYRPTEINPTVSAFFAPRDATTFTTAAEKNMTKPDKEKPPPRKRSPAKKSEASSKKTTTKSKKAVKLASEKLLSPETAKLRLQRQDILFGTSSQLVREDSPSFIRDLQQAMRESEAAFGENADDGIETLHVRPVAAGKGLSLVGTGKGLWAAAARDFDEGFLEIEELEASVQCDDSLTLEASGDALMEALEANPALLSPAQAQTAATFNDVTLPSDGHNSDDAVTQGGEEPIRRYEEAHQHPGNGSVLQDTSKDVPQVDNFEFHPSAQPLPSLYDVSDTEDIVQEPYPPRHASDYIDIDDIPDEMGSSVEERSGMRHPAAAPSPLQYLPSKSPIFSRRTVLQSLPTNLPIPPLQKTISDISGLRGKSTLTSVATPDGGHPSSDPGAVVTKRPRGRPRRDVSAASAQPAEASTKSAKAKKAPSTPRKTKPSKKTPNQEEWTHIDEIEDSEAEHTPTPPRRRNIPAVSPRLQLSPSQQDQDDSLSAPEPSLATSTALTAPVDAALALGGAAQSMTKAGAKTKDAATKHHTPEALAALFPEITRTVRERSENKHSSGLSWHEKILLYDPVVIEDLQEWLNAVGVRMSVVVEAAREKKGAGKAKGKGKAESRKKKKKKKNADAGDAEADAATDEEVLAEDVPRDGAAEAEQRVELRELDAWVVQRWCEEHSVCCVFRDSARNGRRARY